LSWFGDSINLCYYCINEALCLIENYHVMEFSTTTKQMLFSFGFIPSDIYFQTRHC
jgi:hypothetical protein